MVESEHFLVLLFPLVFAQYPGARRCVCVNTLVQDSVDFVQILPDLVVVEDLCVDFLVDFEVKGANSSGHELLVLVVNSVIHVLVPSVVHGFSDLLGGHSCLLLVVVLNHFACLSQESLHFLRVLHSLNFLSLPSGVRVLTHEVLINVVANGTHVVGY